MKRLLLCMLAFFLPISLVFAQTDTVTILHLNDTHSCLAPIGPRNASLQGSLGGIARAATLIGMERMADPKALLLHAGDVSIGDLFYTKYLAAAELQLLVALGCDAMAVGNHEFDLTPAYLDTSLVNGFSSGSFPLLCANVYLEDPAVQPLKSYIFPYTIKQIGNVKVGVFGLTTPTTNVISQPSPAVFDTNFIQTAAAMVDTLATKGCSVIICLSHLGDAFDQLVAQYVPGINLIVGGHDHLSLSQAIQNPSGDTTWIVQANAFYLDLGKVRLTVNGGKVRLLDQTLLPITDAIPEEPNTKAAVDGMIADIELVYGPLFSTKIGDASAFFKEVADSLVFGGPHDTPIGNLVTRAFLATTHTQIAMEVGGSTAQPLYPGPITAEDAFRVIGYGYNTLNGLGYRLVTMEMTGADLWAGLEFGLSNIELDDEYLVQATGLKYTYNAHQPPFARVTGVEVGGQPLDPQATYTVTANEFVPQFLGYLGIPCKNVHICGDTTEFSALSAYIQAHSPLNPSDYVLGGIIEDVTPHRNEDVLPKMFELNQNYPNPFNPTTTVRFALPQKADVKLEIFDILGNLVKTIVDREVPAGRYEVVWDGTDRLGKLVASGIYIYRLLAGSFVVARKMLLVK